MSLAQIGLLLFSTTSIALADILLRKTQILGSVGKALMSPWFIVAVVLYLVQILVFTYLFVSGAKLSHLGVMQAVLYTVLILLASFLIFKESITSIEIVGIALALIGIILINL